MEAVARSQSLSERLAIRGKDEVAAAAEVVNQALDSRERSHSALAASESRHRALVEAIPELLFRISREGTILETRKPQRVASLKDDHDSVEGQSPKDDVLDMIPTEIQHIVVPHMAVALESGQTQVFEFRMSVDGNLSFYEGRVLGTGNDEALVIVRDITDQRRTEQSRQNVALLREIHDRVKSHLKLMRSFSEVGLSQAFNPTPEPGLPAEGQPTDTVMPAEGQEHITELPAEGQPQDADPPAEGQPQNADSPAEAQPQNAEPPAEAQPQNADPPVEAQPQDADPPVEAQPRHTEAVDAVPSAKGN